MEKKTIHHDLFVALGLLVFEVICFRMTYDFKIAETTASFPRVVLVVMMALTVGLAVKSLWMTLRGEGIKRFIWSEVKISILAYIILVCYVLVFWKINYFVAAPILLVALFIYLKFRDWKKIVPIVILYMVAVYFIFVKILGQFRLIHF